MLPQSRSPASGSPVIRGDFISGTVVRVSANGPRGYGAGIEPMPGAVSIAK